jgi:predicted RNA-binding protein with PIN domain
MPLIVDGYNLLRFVQREGHFENLIEVGLCRILSDYLVSVRDRGHIIFDGTGPPDKHDFEQLGGLANLEVYFSGADYEADDVIMQKIEDSSAPKSLIIVSTDREIRAAAAARKATSVRSDVFWQVLISRLETQQKAVHEPKAKRQGITEGETDQWLDFFGIDRD